MKISSQDLALDSWKEKGYTLPSYDPLIVRKTSLTNPTWLHFGAGNIFRAFPARAYQELLNKDVVKSGIVVCETYDEEIIDLAFKPYDNLTIAVTLAANGEMNKTVVASIAAALKLSDSRKQLVEIFKNPSLQLVSFTITEKGYNLFSADGSPSLFISHDLTSDPALSTNTLSVVTYLLYERFLAGRYPLALVSMDNCAENGKKLQEAILKLANSWLSKGYFSSDFLNYLSNPSLISYPWSMIDKITPSPSPKVAEVLSKDGIEDITISKTTKHTNVACFVNAEETEYLVIEDDFPNGRPPLETVGVTFTSRDNVNKIEKMKVGACLNPLHTIMAVYGCLLSYTSISSMTKDKAVMTFVERAAYEELLPYVPKQDIISPEKFLSEVLTKRFPNPFIPDSPARIASDTSLKIPVRFGEALKTMFNSGKDLSKLTYIPLFVAGWFRYLTGVNDQGVKFVLSPDPNLPELTSLISQVKVDNKIELMKSLQSLLSRQNIFGVDLSACGLSEKISDYFIMLSQGPGSIRKTLDKLFL